MSPHTHVGNVPDAQVVYGNAYPVCEQPFKPNGLPGGEHPGCSKPSKSEWGGVGNLSVLAACSLQGRTGLPWSFYPELRYNPGL